MWLVHDKANSWVLGKHPDHYSLFNQLKSWMRNKKQVTADWPHTPAVNVLCALSYSSSALSQPSETPKSPAGLFSQLEATRVGVGSWVTPPSQAGTEQRESLKLVSTKIPQLWSHLGVVGTMAEFWPWFSTYRLAETILMHSLPTHSLTARSSSCLKHSSATPARVLLAG